MNCYFCGEPIIKMRGRDSDSIVIHSLDGNHDNWDKENKVPAHNGCHMRFHNIGKVISVETRNKIRLGQTGEKNHNFGKRGKETSFFGKHHTEETKEKLRLANLGKHMSEESKEKMRLRKLGKLLSKKHKRKIGNSCIKYWTTVTPEERKERGRQMSEGRRRRKYENNIMSKL